MKNKSKKEIYPGIGAIKLLIVSDLRYVKLKKKRWGGGVAVPVSVETKMVLAPILLKVKGAQSCPTVCDPMDYSPWNSPG